MGRERLREEGENRDGGGERHPSNTRNMSRCSPLNYLDKWEAGKRVQAMLGILIISNK